MCMSLMLLFRLCFCFSSFVSIGNVYSKSSDYDAIPSSYRRLFT